jgi:hypothetical protein
MKFLTGTIAALALALTLLAGPTAQAHDTGKLHFHGEQLSQSPAHVCFNNCIEQNGTSAKQSCAMQCGLAGGGMGQGGGQGGGKDCGTLFKQCRKACGSDKACVDQCRDARKQCY